MPGAAKAFAVVLVAGSCALAGCGAAKNADGLPKYDPKAPLPTRATSTAAPRASSTAVANPLVVRASAPPPQVTYVPADAWGEGAWVVRGHINAPSAPARAAVAAMTKYMSLRVQLSNTWQVNKQALAAVASGEAVTTAEARASSQRASDRRSIGRFVINVSAVQISGSTASVTGCHFDGTSEVDHDGNVEVQPSGGVRITMKLQLTGGTWRVTNWPDHPAPLCQARS